MHKQMKVIVNKYLPIKGFVAMMMFGVIFWRKEYESRITNKSYYNKVVNHESIHEAQMLDFMPKWLPKIIRIVFGGFLFYICYVIEWFIRIFINGFKNAYYNISFEKEAYINERNYEYLANRKKFAQWKKI